MYCFLSWRTDISANFVPAFQYNDPTPDLEACAMPSITHGGVTHRLNRLATGNLTPRIASPLPTVGTVRGRGRVGGSRGIGTDAGIPRSRRNAQNTRTTGVGFTNTSGQSHYAVNQFNYLPRVGLRKKICKILNRLITYCNAVTSDSASTLPNPHAEPATAPSGPSPRRRRRHRRGSSAASGGQQVRSSTPSAIPSTARALHPAGELASPEDFMAAVRTSRDSGMAPSDPGHAEPAADGMQRRPALYPGVAERPLLSPSTVERGNALLHAEDPAESTAILSGSDTSGNGNAGGNCDTRGNGTGNGNGDNTGNDNGNSTGSSGNDDNASSGDRNDTDDSGCQFSSEPLNTILSMIETFTSALKTGSHQPLETLPGGRHHTEALRVETHRDDTHRDDTHRDDNHREDTHREEVPSDETRTESHKEEPHQSGLLDSKWAPRN